MDQATLVNLDVTTGLEILAALDAAQIKVVIALWMLSSDYDDWRFVLSSPSLDQTQMLKAYQKVAEALQGRFVHMRPAIQIFPTKDPFVRDLRKMFGNAKDVMGLRLGGQMIGKKFISDAYVYRVQ